MGTKSPGPPQRCQLILQQCLAIQLTKPGQTPDDFWMYDSGYMIFQNFLAANSKCWWNAPLTAATRSLKYAGHVAPGMLLVTAEPCALEILRGAYARSVLKPPATYVISSVGDIDDCVIQPTLQTQFTPLPEALCDVIMDLTSQGQSATLENIKAELGTKFPHMQQPSTDIIYDALAQLMQERKIYQTSKGYFIVTPERRRSRSRPRGHPNSLIEQDDEPYDSRTILMTNSEALHSLYGEITTERDGDLTHQCIQTNLADVICGGNPNDKILYPRASKRRSASFPTPRSLERRHSLRLFGSSKRLQRCASTRTFSFRSLSKNYAQTLTTDSSSSEYQSTDSSSPKKSASLLSRLFRRSGRSKQKNIQTYAGQFPPAEWFNSKAVHLHSVGTQTLEHDVPGHTLSSSTFYAASEVSSQRSLTLPRRHRRHLSSESTFLISSRDCSPIRRRSPQCYSGSLPRSTHSIPNSARSPKRQPLLGKAPEDATRAKSAAEVYKNRNAVDTKIASEREKHKSIYSGPSSLESGKTSGGCIASGPSSIESGRFPYSRTSGHSSLDSQASSSATTVTTSQSPVRSSIIKPAASRKMSPADIEIGLPSSQSSNSITLQVNSSSSAMPSTKIFVQNSPVRSVITFENGKLSDNSNVYIINSEKTTHANGEVTTHKSVSRQASGPKLAPKATCSDCEEEESLSLISETSPDSSLTVNNDFEVTKFTKNINNENVTMNNNRKLNSHLPQNGGNFVYKNVLKDVPSSPTSPNNKNFFGDTKTYEQMAGSVGNLRQLDSQPKKLNSNVDLKTMVVVENNLKLQNTNMSMMNLLRKNSEPNLSVKTIEKQKIADATKKDNIDRRMSLSKDQRQQQTEQENAGSNYTFPSLTDLSFNFTSIAAQKILQGVSINSIDTLCELNLQSHQEKAAATQPNGTNICTDYGMV